MDEERYEITSLIGKGRTGGVYAADELKLGRKVAIRRFFCVQGDTSVEGWEEEFKNIAQNLCLLNDPNILQVLDAGTDEDGAFLVTQLVEGTRLSDHLAERPLTQNEAYDLATHLLEALITAHEAGFIHGAITAGSIHMVKRNNGEHRYILMDLGLAKLAPLIQGTESSLGVMADLALTAPRLFDGSAANESTDCYSVGHLVYMCLIGGHPFALLGRDELEKAHKEGGLPPLTKYRTDLNPAFLEWIDTLTESSIDKRVSSASEALSTLPKKSELTTSFASTQKMLVTERNSQSPLPVPPSLALPPKHPTAPQPITPAPSLAPLIQERKKAGLILSSGFVVSSLIVLGGLIFIGSYSSKSNKRSSQEITKTPQQASQISTPSTPPVNLKIDFGASTKSLGQREPIGTEKGYSAFEIPGIEGAESATTDPSLTIDGVTLKIIGKIAAYGGTTNTNLLENDYLFLKANGEAFGTDNSVRFEISDLTPQTKYKLTFTIGPEHTDRGMHFSGGSEQIDLGLGNAQTGSITVTSDENGMISGQATGKGAEGNWAALTVIPEETPDDQQAQKKTTTASR